MKMNDLKNINLCLNIFIYNKKNFTYSYLQRYKQSFLEKYILNNSFLTKQMELKWYEIYNILTIGSRMTSNNVQQVQDVQLI